MKLPPAAAGMLLNLFCREGDWDGALKTADALMETNDPALVQTATLAQVRYALYQALEKDLEGAEATLTRLGK